MADQSPKIGLMQTHIRLLLEKPSGGSVLYTIPSVLVGCFSLL